MRPVACRSPSGDTTVVDADIALRHLIPDAPAATDRPVLGPVGRCSGSAYGAFQVSTN